MSKLRVHGFGVSLDGYGAGPSQDLENPLGVGGPGLHEWILPTRTFQLLSQAAANGWSEALAWWGAFSGLADIAPYSEINGLFAAGLQAREARGA